MIYYTGDIHGSTYEPTRFCHKMNLAEDDVKLLDTSREYWLSQGITDWGLVIDAEKRFDPVRKYGSSNPLN